MDRAQFFEKKMGKPLRVLFRRCPDDVLQERLYSRALGQLRFDDNHQSISNRIGALHNGDIAQVLDYYEQQGILIKVDASKSQADVLASIEHGLGLHLNLLGVLMSQVRW